MRIFTLFDLWSQTDGPIPACNGPTDEPIDGQVFVQSCEFVTKKSAYLTGFFCKHYEYALRFTNFSFCNFDLKQIKVGFLRIS